MQAWAHSCLLSRHGVLRLVTRPVLLQQPAALRQHSQHSHRPVIRFRSSSQGQDAAAGPGPGGGSSGGSSPAGVAEYSDEELRRLTEHEEQETETELGEAWRSLFAGDLEGLFDFVDRGYADMEAMEAAVEQIPEQMRDRLNAYFPLTKMPPGMATDLVGMGTWRLKDDVEDVISFLVSRIEGSLRELLQGDMALYPPDKWKAKGWDFMDSMDPKKEWDGFSYVDIPDPQKGEEGYPRLMVENRIYSSRVFRKLHLEVAWRQDGLQVLHVVFYPRYDFDIPILAMDMVIAGGNVSLAIIDACPLSSNLTLPGHYMTTMQELQETFLPGGLQERSIPDWGKAIFSPMCLCMRPTSAEELAGFMKYSVALTRAHLAFAGLLRPIEPKDKPSVLRLKQLLAGHQRFCEQQLANTKTSRVLEVAFDEEFTQAYMSKLMFDFDPKDSPPWFDGGLAQLYDYFESNPEPWQYSAPIMATQEKLDLGKAQDNLRRLMAGDKAMLGPRLAFTMRVMFEQDEEFQSAVLQTMPGAAEAAMEGRIGDFLGEQFAEQAGLAQQQQEQQQQQPAAAAAAAAEQQQGGKQQQQQGPPGGSSSSEAADDKGGGTPPEKKK